MPDKPNALHTLGLELDTPHLKGAQLTLKKGRPSLEKLFLISLDIPATSTQDNVKPLYMEQSEKLSPLRSALAKDLVVTPINTSEVLVRPLEVKLKKESNIDSVLTFQSEPILPYPVEQALLDRIKIAQTPEGTQLIVLAVRKDHLAQHLDLWQSLKIEPEVVSSLPTALAAFATLFAPTENPRFVVHIGLNSSTCILVKDNKLAAAQACPLGVSTLERCCAADSAGAETVHSVDFTALDSAKMPSLSNAVENLRMEITRTVYALGKQAKGKKDISTGPCGCWGLRPARPQHQQQRRQQQCRRPGPAEIL